MMRSWGRWVVLAAICLCAGAVSTVLVAWACVLWVPWPSTGTPAALDWPRPTPRDWPASPDSAHWSDAWFVASRVARHTQTVGSTLGMEPGWNQQVLIAGWPFVAMEWEGVTTTIGGRIKSHAWLSMWRAPTWIAPDPSMTDRRMLPLRPHLSGFI